MNFSDSPRTTRIAENIPLGHNALVYVTRHVKKFIWTIQYTGTLAHGQQIVHDYAHLMPPPAVITPPDAIETWDVNLLPIKFLAVIEPAKARNAQDVLHEAGVVFNPPQASMKSISQAEYERIFNVIQWDMPG